MKTRYLILTLAIVLVLVAFSACTGNNGHDEPPDHQAAAPNDTPEDSSEQDAAMGEVTITFDYKRQSGTASNQFAVWIEDMDGELVQTLYATRFTTKGGYENRPEALCLWVEKSGIADMTKPEIDAISSATPSEGALSYKWDLTGLDGELVKPGKYQFFVEGTLRWKNNVVYSGTIDTSGDAVTVAGKAEFNFEESNNNDALTDDSPESGMISQVKAGFTP